MTVTALLPVARDGRWRRHCPTGRLTAGRRSGRPRPRRVTRPWPHPPGWPGTTVQDQ